MAQKVNTELPSTKNWLNVISFNVLQVKRIYETNQP